MFATLIYIFELKVGLSSSKKVVFICFNKSPLKVLKHAFYFMSKALFVLEISTFLYWLFGHIEKRPEKKTKVNFKTYDVTGWATNNYNTFLVKYLIKSRCFPVNNAIILRTYFLWNTSIGLFWKKCFLVLRQKATQILP